jgi:hypothetical protein
MGKHVLTILAMAALCFSTTSMAAEAWKPVEGGLMTRWADDVKPDKPWPEYPRPKMVREDWANLNGLWEYAITPRDTPVSNIKFQSSDKILVPFCVESALSGVKKGVGAENRLWYRRSFKTPAAWKGQRVLLHFGAVDWDCTVLVNGKEIGSHRGGYDPFAFDITDALKQGANELVVSVWDPTSDGTQARGKQVKNPRGIWYTPVSGIWQTVWLEPVARTYIQSLKIIPDVDGGQVLVTVNVAGGGPSDVWARAATGGSSIGTVKGKSGEPLALKVDDAKLWSPDSPFLYDLEVGIENGDTVQSYFGMRKVSMAKDDEGVLRMLLNDTFVFHYGPLDQGWWPDGLYTPPTDEAMVYDLKVLKDLGMNMLRKHVKVAPERLYHHCDKMGLLVWQDMPSGNFGKDDAAKQQYRVEHQRLIDFLHNYPCIVMWVPFNEGWGQHDTPEVADWVKEFDPTRLVNEASGWHDKKSGDIRDMHKYPGPAIPALEEKRVAVLGEFGGLGLPVPGHLWWNKRNWGYRNYKSRQELQHHYDTLIHKLRPMIAKGLCAAVYTQTTDVEGEVNGLMTYDREVLKLDAEHSAALHACLYDPALALPEVTALPPPPKVTVIVPTSEQKGQVWRYTTEQPGAGWMNPDFDDTSWQTGTGMFGTKSTPGTRIETEWKTSDIYLRRPFELEAVPSEPVLRVFHDEDAEIYINGKRVKKLAGYVTEIVNVPLGEAAGALRKGRNTLAVHCRQTRGGQGIDAGIVEIEKN